MASISHSSTFTGVPASEVTASTITNAPCLCAIWVSVFASDWQPVEVSACTKATMAASLFFFSASSTFCGSTGSPHLSSTSTGVPQHRIEIADRGLAHGRQHARMDLGRAGAHQRALRRMEGLDALAWRVLAHGIALCQTEGKVFGARFDAHRILGARLVDDLERADAGLRDALDLAGPARRHIAGLHPVVDHRTVQLEGAGDVGLAAKNLDQALRAVHRRAVYSVNFILTRQRCRAS